MIGTFAAGNLYCTNRFRIPPSGYPFIVEALAVYDRANLEHIQATFTGMEESMLEIGLSGIIKRHKSIIK